MRGQLTDKIDEKQLMSKKELLDWIDFELEDEHSQDSFEVRQKRLIMGQERGEGYIDGWHGALKEIRRRYYE